MFTNNTYEGMMKTILDQNEVKYQEGLFVVLYNKHKKNEFWSVPTSYGDVSHTKDFLNFLKKALEDQGHKPENETQDLTVEVKEYPDGTFFKSGYFLVKKLGNSFQTPCMALKPSEAHDFITFMEKVITHL
jgi:hypothetical protein